MINENKDRKLALELLENASNDLDKNLLMKDIFSHGLFYLPHVYKLISLHPGKEDYCEKAYKLISKMIMADNDKELTGKTPRRDMTVRVSMAARVNFAGVFTDIPPYCYEEGGSVLNSAALLNGEYPIVVTAQRIKGSEFVFESIDEKVKTIIKNGEELALCTNLNGDCVALHKAICHITGISGGIKLTTLSKVPMGSGLGTSSIIIAAALKALYILFDYDIDDEYIINKVLITEQLLTVGGGWQDQCGGLFPGIKVISSKEGLPQKVKIKNIELADSTVTELEKRLMLIYTGKKRLAKNILREISGGYLLRNKENMKTFREIKELPGIMADVLENGDINGFGELLNRQFELNKKLNNSCSNSHIEKIVAEIREMCDGILICGAGGGGFLIVLLKENMNSNNLPYKSQNISLCINEKSYKVEII